MPTTVVEPLSSETITATAKLLREDLGEPFSTLKYLALIVKTIGIARSGFYLHTAQKLHEQGTQLTKDGKRQRTLGGIFFRLVQQDYPELAAPAKQERHV